jgi:hypothetical protein
MTEGQQKQHVPKEHPQNSGMQASGPGWWYDVDECDVMLLGKARPSWTEVK